MAHPQIAAFPRLGKENTLPTRSLEGQQTLLSRTMHDIRYDAIHDEIVVTSPLALAVLTFRGGANGEEPPLRVIQGPKTQLIQTDYAALDKVDVDPMHNEIFVPTLNSISVFPREANGDVPPLRVIKGPDTQLRSTWMGGGSVAVDPAHNLIVAANSGGASPEERELRQSRERNPGELLIFNRTDNGNVKPRAVIRGPKTGIVANINQIAVYPPRGWILATIPRSFVGIWSINDNGDVPPRWKIAIRGRVIKSVRGVALDPKNKELIVADSELNAVLTYYFPEMF